MQLLIVALNGGQMVTSIQASPSAGFPAWKQVAYSFTLVTPLFLFGTGLAVADGLFRLPNSVERRAAGPLLNKAPPVPAGVELTRSTILRADPDYVRSRLFPPHTEGLSEAERNAAAERLDPEISMRLFPDVVLTLHREALDASPGDARTFLWSGYAKPPHACDVFITVTDGIFGGEIACYGAKTYLVSHLTGDLYQVAETNPPPMLPDFEDLDDSSAPTSVKRCYTQALMPFEAAQQNITVLIIKLARGAASASDPAPSNEWDNLVAELPAAADPVQSEFDKANRILRNSGVMVTLLNDSVYDMSDGGNHMTSTEVLTKVSTGAPPFEIVKDIRYEGQVDLVSVWYTPKDNVCGRGNAPANPGPGTADKAFSVTAVGRPGCRFTFLHELGHNFGLRHDRYTVGDTNPDACNFGFANVSQQISRSWPTTRNAKIRT